MQKVKMEVQRVGFCWCNSIFGCSIKLFFGFGLNVAVYSVEFGFSDLK